MWAMYKEKYPLIHHHVFGSKMIKPTVCLSSHIMWKYTSYVRLCWWIACDKKSETLVFKVLKNYNNNFLADQPIIVCLFFLQTKNINYHFSLFYDLSESYNQSIIMGFQMFSSQRHHNFEVLFIVSWLRLFLIFQMWISQE